MPRALFALDLTLPGGARVSIDVPASADPPVLAARISRRYGLSAEHTQLLADTVLARLQQHGVSAHRRQAARKAGGQARAAASRAEANALAEPTSQPALALVTIQGSVRQGFATAEIPAGANIAVFITECEESSLRDIVAGIPADPSFRQRIVALRIVKAPVSGSCIELSAGGGFPALELLDLSDTAVQSFSGLGAACPTVQMIRAVRTKLATLAGLDGCDQLAALDVSACPIRTIAGLAPAGVCPALAGLSIADIPMLRKASSVQELVGPIREALPGVPSLCMNRYAVKAWRETMGMAAWLDATAPSSLSEPAALPGGAPGPAGPAVQPVQVHAPLSPAAMARAAEAHRALGGSTVSLQGQSSLSALDDVDAAISRARAAVTAAQARVAAAESVDIAADITSANSSCLDASAAAAAADPNSAIAQLHPAFSKFRDQAAPASPCSPAAALLQDATGLHDQLLDVSAVPSMHGSVSVHLGRAARERSRELHPASWRAQLRGDAGRSVPQPASRRNSASQPLWSEEDAPHFTASTYFALQHQQQGEQAGEPADAEHASRVRADSYMSLASSVVSASARRAQARTAALAAQAPEHDEAALRQEIANARWAHSLRDAQLVTAGGSGARSTRSGSRTRPRRASLGSQRASDRARRAGWPSDCSVSTLSRHDESLSIMSDVPCAAVHSAAPAAQPHAVEHVAPAARQAAPGRAQVYAGSREVPSSSGSSQPADQPRACTPAAGSYDRAQVWHPAMPAQARPQQVSSPVSATSPARPHGKLTEAAWAAVRRVQSMTHSADWGTQASPVQAASMRGNTAPARAPVPVRGINPWDARVSTAAPPAPQLGSSPAHLQHHVDAALQALADSALR